MKKLTYKELCNLWFDFYRSKQHAIIPSASVVPENDASVLFINSGMHPLVPYLMGESHPAGVRLANIQKCIRTGDIEDVGNPKHLTFFEMMGNWSLGDYFKREKVAWSWEFLTGKEWLAIAPERIHVTCFEGDEIAPRDDESAQLWREQGVPDERIYFLPKSENWWQLPNGTGPCGPCSEMFLELNPGACGEGCNPSCDCGRFVEIGNDVYMQFVIHNAGEKPAKAKQQNVDTGMGLERLLCFSNNVRSVYDTELFLSALRVIKWDTDAYNDCAGIDVGKLIKDSEKSSRILAEHTRTATVMIGDGVVPSNSGQGYVLRRLVRRAVRMANKLGCGSDIYEKLIDIFVGILGDNYPELRTNRDNIVRVYTDEVAKFEKSLAHGLREFERAVSSCKEKKLCGKTAFRLYESYGFPIEVTHELCDERGLEIDMDEFNAAKKKHAEQSQTAAAGSFKGGLADTSGETVKLHTAAHLLLHVLREVFGKTVTQKGSNITPERLRFDFNLDNKLTEDEVARVEARVNQLIAQNLPVVMAEMNIKDAEAMGAHGTFHAKYGDVVKVYSIGDDCHEFCGGPHVASTGGLGVFKIAKQESVSAGVRRIKATLS